MDCILKISQQIPFFVILPNYFMPWVTKSALSLKSPEKYFEIDVSMTRVFLWFTQHIVLLKHAYTPISYYIYIWIYTNLWKSGASKMLLLNSKYLNIRIAYKKFLSKFQFFCVAKELHAESNKKHPSLKFLEKYIKMNADNSYYSLI